MHPFVTFYLFPFSGIQDLNIVVWPSPLSIFRTPPTLETWNYMPTHSGLPLTITTLFFFLHQLDFSVCLLWMGSFMFFFYDRWLISLNIMFSCFIISKLSRIPLFWRLVNKRQCIHTPHLYSHHPQTFWLLPPCGYYN